MVERAWLPPGGRLFFASGPLNRKQKEKSTSVDSVGSSDHRERARDQNTQLVQWHPEFNLPEVVLKASL
jgi:hypothetical protein